jgi:hypothetical protein
LRAYSSVASYRTRWDGRWAKLSFDKTLLTVLTFLPTYLPTKSSTPVIATTSSKHNRKFKVKSPFLLYQLNLIPKMGIFSPIGPLPKSLFSFQCNASPRPPIYSHPRSKFCLPAPRYSRSLHIFSFRHPFYFKKRERKERKERKRGREETRERKRARDCLL